MEDWQAVPDLVGESGWKCRYSEGDAVPPVPAAEAALSRSADLECPELRVWLAEVLAIFRLHAVKGIDFDVDLREPQGQGRLDVFCGLLRAIGRRLGKSTLMDPEGDHGHPALGSASGLLLASREDDGARACRYLWQRPGRHLWWEWVDRPGERLEACPYPHLFRS